MSDTPDTPDTPDTEIPEEPAARKIVLATAGALVVAAVVFFAFLLPAERGYDPWGTGELFGLLSLNQDRPLETEEARHQLHREELVLLPYEWVEFKYRLAEGASMVFSWTATSPVTVDFHAQPDGAPAKYAESFERTEGVAEGQGTYIATFPGLHGWYWENTSGGEVTVRLESAGFYTAAHEYRDRVAGDRELVPLDDVRYGPGPPAATPTPADSGGGVP